MDFAKIKLKAFNNCPGREDIIKYIDENISDDGFNSISVFDRDKDYWKNDDSTLVLAIPYLYDMKDINLIYTLASKFDADEFHAEMDQDQCTYLRIWWD